MQDTRAPERKRCSKQPIRDPLIAVELVLKCLDLSARKRVSTRTQPQPDHEYEHKFAVSQAQAEAFFETIETRLRQVLYQPSLPIAFARTTYFDTKERRYLASSHTAHARRIRVREYAGAAHIDALAQMTGVSYLECKESHAGTRHKRRLRIGREDIAALLTGRWRGADYTTDTANFFVREFENGGGLRPLLTTWYRRQAFASGDQIRVTLDSELAFCRPIEAADIADDERGVGFAERMRATDVASDRVVERPPTCVLEIKHRGSAPDWLRDAMTQLGAPPSVRLSKYLQGMAALGVELRASGQVARSG